MHRLLKALGVTTCRLEELEEALDHEREVTLQALDERQRLTREATHAARGLRQILQSEFASEMRKAQRYIRREPGR